LRSLGRIDVGSIRIASKRTPDTKPEIESFSRGGIRIAESFWRARRRPACREVVPIRRQKPNAMIYRLRAGANAASRPLMCRANEQRPIGWR
jgi:hypothetical protein